MRIGRILIIALAAGAAGGWIWSAPPAPGAAPTGGDAEAGALILAAAGCASCHKGPDDESDGPPVLAGGQAFPSPFGTFYAPNVSSDPVQGIGAWTDDELAHAIRAGVSPDGRYYYPVFPTHAYAKMTDGDLADLIAHLRTLPPSEATTLPHEVGFPATIRRGLAVWRAMFAQEGWVLDAGDDPQLERGRYLVEALGHCAECHTPRNALGGLQTGAWMAGAEIYGKDGGRTPGITTEALGWSESDITAYLETGLTPEFDSAGGKMVDVIDNTAQLSDADRAAIAAYLLAL